MCTADSNEMTIKEKNKLEFEKALELRNFEIENFWKRGWFFGALLLAIFTAYYNNELFPSSCISFIAFIVSGCQSLMNRGSKYWQERWEYVTKNRESALGIDLTRTRKYKKERLYIDHSILAKNENGLTVSRRFSVTKLTFLVWDIITISCFLVWINDVINSISFNKNNIDIQLTIKVGFFYILLLGYILYFFWGGCVDKDDDNNKRKTGKVYEPHVKEYKEDEQEQNKYFEESERYVRDKECY